ncbi:MAG: hypothetical protein ABSD27_00180 [Bryobacteraceae bacterium]|jgi:hypothetical protein
MKSLSFALLLCFAAASICAAEKKYNWERARVLSQNMHSSPVGAYAAPIGNATIAVPIYRRSNYVVVETDTHRLEWSEVGSSAIILPVNGSIEFYRDGNWFIVLDSKKKKHKFALVGMTLKTDK